LMEPRKILFICDQSDIPIIESSFANEPGYNITLETSEKIFNIGVKEYLRETIHLINSNPDMFDAVIGTHDSSAVFAAVICEQTGKIFASINGIINCQNKYVSRTIQSRCVPECTPDFCLDRDFLQGNSNFAPVFVKPARSNVSFSSQQINSPDTLLELIALNTEKIIDYNGYFVDALAISTAEQPPQNLETLNRFLCEEVIKGDQVTVDGYVFNDDVKIFGVTKAHFFEDGISFKHHEFPYDLNPTMQSKIHSMVINLIPALGLNNTFFNVELRIDEVLGEINIIEVNSRIAFQFAKTIKAVRGFDPLLWLCEVATGRKPTVDKDIKLAFKYCYNFELRKFKDKKIIKTPIKANLEEIKISYPEIEIRNIVKENTYLSDYKQNPASYRYCILDIPGNNREEIMNKFEQIKPMLGYQFEDI